MLTRETVIDKIEILETGHIQIRRATYFVEDSIRTLGGYHRVAYNPGADVAAEDTLVRSVAQLIWTPEVLAAHNRRILAQQKQP